MNMREASTMTETESIGHIATQIEAILFVAEQPVPAVSLASVLEIPLPEAHAALEALGKRLAEAEGATELREAGGGWRLYVRSKYDETVRKYVGEEIAPKLSQAALETLAVIAYKQPITRGQVSAVRAVNVDSVVRTLVSRGFVQEAGLDPATGAVLFETTPLLLEKLGLNSLDELPPISPLLPNVDEIDVDE